jgi:ribosomal protein S6
MVIIVPDISDEEIAEGLGRINKYITDVDGEIREVLTDSPWGRRRLAYSIRFNSIDYRDGYYAVYHFDARPDRVIEIERELKLDVRVIRYLVVHDDPKAGVQSANNPDGEPVAEAAQGTPAVRPAAAPVEVPAPVDTEAPVAAETAEAPVADEATAPEAAAEDAAPVAEVAEDAAPVAEVAEETAPVAETEETETTPEEASKES